MITVVLPIRDRDKTRVYNNLYTLCHQTLIPEIIVVNYGSNKAITTELTVLARVFPRVQLVNCSSPRWVKTKANNIGLRKVKTPYVLFSDIDMIYCPQFIETISKKLTSETIVTCQCKYLGNEETRRLKMPLDWERFNPPIIQTSGETAVGACLGVSTSWAMDVHGFDEEYLGWGREDIDFLKRALLAGKTQLFLKELGFYHQWHEASSWHQDKSLVEKNIRRFDEMTEKRKVIIRNESKWGFCD